MKDKRSKTAATQRLKTPVARGLPRPAAPAFLIIFVLVAAVLAVYWPVTGCGFTNMDDPEYFSNNAHVLGGLSWENIRWAFQTGYTGYWQPTVWLSYMLDVTLFGKGPAGPHGVNVLLHAANTVLLFVLLRRMTRSQWRSAFVSALFALHPLRVESVAWITERKDVLSAFFGFLSLLFYLRYVAAIPQKPKLNSKSYWFTLFFFALALMSKPMLVTIPFLMMLLDCWPLGRFQGSDRNQKIKLLAALAAEKTPLFLLSLLSSIVTLQLQQKVGAVAAMGGPSWELRLQNAFVSFAQYLAKTFWPVDLACPYPLLSHWPYWEVGGSVLLFVMLGGGAVGLGRKYPYLFTGWYWFIGALVPVIGLIQSGQQSMADRFTYLPSIGLFIALAWGARELLSRWKLPAPLTIFIAVLILGACAMRTRAQLAYWKNSETLFNHTLLVTKNNYIAHYNLGLDLFEKGQVNQAIQQYEQSLTINPNDADTHNNLGSALLEQGRLQEAAVQFQNALSLKPDDTDAYVNLGNIYFQVGKINEAIGQYQKALEFNPHIAEAHNNLGSAFFQQGHLAEAILHLQKALEINPQYLSAENNLAWLLATSADPAFRNGPKAVQLAEHVNQLSDKTDPLILRTLAAAYAATGRLPEAVATAQRAVQLATAQNHLALATTLQTQLKFYEAGAAFYENGPAR